MILPRDSAIRIIAVPTPSPPLVRHRTPRLRTPRPDAYHYSDCLHSVAFIFPSSTLFIRQLEDVVSITGKPPMCVSILFSYLTVLTSYTSIYERPVKQVEAYDLPQ